MKSRSRAGLFALSLIVSGCAEGAKFLEETENGGVVVYPYKGEQGNLLSSFRKDALRLMEKKCGGPYSIVREGETRGRSRVFGSVEGGHEIVQERRWGIQFQCK